MGYFSIVTSLMIIICVLCFEIFRHKKGVLDFLSGINIVYIMAFGIAPLYIYFFYENTTWDTIKQNDLTNTAFFVGSLLSIICYLCIVIGYKFAGRLRIINSVSQRFDKAFEQVNDKVLFKLGIILFAIGFVSLILYINVLGGLSVYLEAGAIIRSGRQDIFVSPFMFLKSFVPFLFIASFVFYALLIQSQKNKGLYFLFFFLSLAGSLLQLYHNAGRISVFTYILTFPLAHILLKNRIKWRSVFLLILFFIFIVTMGDIIWNPYYQQDIGQVISESFSNIGVTIGGVIEEFTFPFTNIANNILLFPTTHDYRYGIDVLLGIKEVLPSRLISFDFMNQKSISQINTEQFGSIGTIPIDTISFGFISFGLAGVMLVGIVFGILARFIESMFNAKKNITSAIFASTWLMAVGFALVYGEPGQVYSTNFKIIVSTILLVYLLKPTKIRAEQLK